MSFLSRENSLFGGRPIRLYEFQRGGMRWFYTSANRDIDFEAHKFLAIAISDDGLRRTGEVSADTTRVRVPWNNPVAKLFRGAPPSDEVQVIIRDSHKDEPEVRISWSGSVIGAQFPSPERAELICETFGGSLERPGLWLSWDRGCSFSVFDLDCGLDRAAFKVPATVQALDGATISSTSFDALADGHFDGGYVEWDVGSGVSDRRSVEKHIGSVLTLLGGTEGLAVGQDVDAYPGCPLIISVCDRKFANHLRYGGIPHLPGKSPFDGDPIFW